MTYSEALKTLKEKLAHLYTPDEQLQLLSLLTDIPRTQLSTQKNNVLNKHQEEIVLTAIPALLESKPIQYITGKAHFFGLEFLVNEHTLIPRPETEELVDWVLKSHSDAANFKVLDIGTGSGCIPIVIKKKRPNFEVSAVDISAKALIIARKNAALNQLEINFSEKDVLNATLDHSFDIIISNPPYIIEAEKQEMEANVLDFEPHTALFVPNNDPLLFYRRIAELASTHLHTGGLVYFEINAKYGRETVNLLEEQGFSKVELMKDMQGKDRFVRGIWLA